MQETRVWSVMKETPNLCPMSSIYKADGRHACLSCPICSTPSNQPSRRCGTSSMLRSRQACLSCPCPVCSTPRNQPSIRRGAPSLCSTSNLDEARHPTGLHSVPCHDRRGRPRELGRQDEPNPTHHVPL